MRRFALALVLALATACGDTSGPDTGHTGTYTLRSVDGDPLPATLYEDGTDYVRVVGGSLTLDADGTFSTQSTINYRMQGETGTETGTLFGTYTRSGSSIVMTDSDGDVFTATYDGNDQLTMSEDGVVVVYRK